MKTVKPYATLETSSRELFGDVILSKKEIRHIQNKLKKEADRNNCKITFLDSDGINLYIYDMNLDEDRISILNSITKRNKKNASAWKFGFMNKNSGKILMLFGGHTVADKESAIDVFKIACSIVKERFQPKENEELITFSIQK